MKKSNWPHQIACPCQLCELRRAPGLPEVTRQRFKVARAKWSRMAIAIRASTSARWV